MNPRKQRCSFIFIQSFSFPVWHRGPSLGQQLTERGSGRASTSAFLFDCTAFLFCIGTGSGPLHYVTRLLFRRFQNRSSISQPAPTCIISFFRQVHLGTHFGHPHSTALYTRLEQTSHAAMGSLQVDSLHPLDESNQEQVQPTSPRLKLFNCVIPREKFFTEQLSYPTFWQLEQLLCDTSVHLLKAIRNDESRTRAPGLLSQGTRKLHRMSLEFLFVLWADLSYSLGGAWHTWLLDKSEECHWQSTV